MSTKAEVFVPKSHWLKIAPQYLEAHKKGLKSFEIRRNDRNYKIGNALVLQEWTERGGFTGQNVVREITYITDFPDGLKPGYIVMGLRPL